LCSAQEATRVRQAAGGVVVPLPVPSFGLVIKWTINPMIVVNGIHASTVTRVAFGELRRFASFITQMAITSQIARLTPH
jgi:hypothetical protein